MEIKPRQTTGPVATADISGVVGIGYVSIIIFPHQPTSVVANAINSSKVAGIDYICVSAISHQAAGIVATADTSGIARIDYVCVITTTSY